MKTLICFFFTWLFLSSSNAQTDFQKYFDFSTGDYLTDMILTSDNNLLLCGYTSYGILVIKTDLSGEVIWEKDIHWSVNSKAFDICEAPTNDIYLGGFYNTNHGFVMRLNSDGDSITSKVYNSDTYIYAIGAVGSEIIISLQVHYPGQNAGYTHIFSTDTLFNNTAISISYDMCMIHKIAVKGNDWYFSGYDTWYCKSFIKKLYSFSNEYYVSWPDDLVIKDNNSIYFSHSGGSWGTIIKTNETGDILWTSTISSSGNYAYSIQFYKNKLIATGHIASKYYFSIIDTLDGEVDTTFQINNYYIEYGVGMVINEDDLYIAGHYKETDSIDDFNIFLNKYSLDTLITAIDDSKYKIDKINIYPNPAIDKVNISLGNTDLNQNITLKCFSISGKLVFETPVNPWQNEISTMVSTWPQGIYVAVVYSDDLPVGQCKFVVK